MKLGNPAAVPKTNYKSYFYNGVPNDRIYPRVYMNGLYERVRSRTCRIFQLNVKNLTIIVVNQNTPQ